MPTNDYELLTPSEVDTEIASFSARLARVEVEIQRQRKYRDDDGYLRHHYSEAKLDEAEAEANVLRTLIHELDMEYIRRGGWTRYFHVTNTNGHIHESMHCSSCLPTTQYSWRTDLSGLTMEEVVEREAYNACSVCLPIAPAEQRQAREYYNRQQREARAAEKQAKKNEKLAKQAERAVKFLAKVDKAVEKHCGSWEAFRSDYSLYGHDGRKSVYDLDVPTQVGNYLYDEKEAQEAAERGTRPSSRHMKDPKAIIKEAREKGLL